MVKEKTTETAEKVKETVKKVVGDIGEAAKELAEEAPKIVEDVIKNVKDAVGKNDSDKKISKKELEKAAEAESTDVKEVKTLEEKKKELLAKAKKLAGKIKETKTEELKEKVKGKKKTDMLIPLEDYVKSGIYLGTRVVTPNMKPFVYRRRADGLAIFNTDLIDEKLKEGIEYLAKFNPEDIIIVCKRQAGWKAVEMFSELTGIRVFTKNILQEFCRSFDKYKFGRFL